MEPFKCQGSCNDIDIKLYDKAFFMNINFFLSKSPGGQVPNKNSFISFILLLPMQLPTVYFQPAKPT